MHGEHDWEVVLEQRGYITQGTFIEHRLLAFGIPVFSKSTCTSCLRFELERMSY